MTYSQSVKLNVQIERWPIAGAFTISRGAKTQAVMVVAEVSRGGHTGRGECVPYPRYGETPEATLAALKPMRELLRRGLDRQALQAAMPAGAARNALDCALLDLEAKTSGQRAWALLGRPAPRVPVNASKYPVHSYSKDGAMRVQPVSDPVYAPNSKGGPAATHAYQVDPGWAADGQIVRSAYVDHPEDDDFGQAGTLVREVLDDGERERLADNIIGHLLNAVSEPVLERAFEYWNRVDPDLGKTIQEGVRAKADETDPKAADQGNSARSSMQEKA